MPVIVCVHLVKKELGSFLGQFVWENSCLNFHLLGTFLIRCSYALAFQISLFDCIIPQIFEMDILFFAKWNAPNLHKSRFMEGLAFGEFHLKSSDNILEISPKHIGRIHHWHSLFMNFIHPWYDSSWKWDLCISPGFRNAHLQETMYYLQTAAQLVGPT